MVSSDRNWQAWGESDPYYAVLTDPRFRGESSEAARQDFFDGGRAYIDDTLARVEMHFGSIARERALDFGCGVGRLTIPLAQHFTSVTGLDISSAMLEEAHRNSAGFAIDYRLSDDRLTALDGTFDFINSCIVLQHIPIERGMVLLDGLLARVRPAGGCAIHLSIKRRQNRRQELLYAVRHRIPGGQALLNLLSGKSAKAPVMQMNEYSLADVIRLFNVHGFGDLLMRYGDHGEVDTVLILARRR
ncbi:MAG TPA: methyltransferase domain-containing protein [Sphingobium sp.]|uniref:methyltransferase domain-containing protein n=1 Tax=Sphingobium sp. TaxID=1912891 RepID=UPI002ED38E31